MVSALTVTIKIANQFVIGVEALAKQALSVDNVSLHLLAVMAILQDSD